MVESVMDERVLVTKLHTKNIRGDCDNTACTTDYCGDVVLHLN